MIPASPSERVKALRHEAALLIQEAARVAATIGVENGWEHAADYLEMGGKDPIAIETGEWIWRDADGRVRRTYGFAGSSYLRVHTFDEAGNLLIGVEVRDLMSAADIDADYADDTGVMPNTRAIAGGTPTSRAEAHAKWPDIGWDAPSVGVVAAVAARREGCP